jgi:hypothetical protein
MLAVSNHRQIRAPERCSCTADANAAQRVSLLHGAPWLGNVRARRAIGSNSATGATREVHFSCRSS